MQHDPVPGAKEDDLLRQLAMIGAPCEPPQSDHAGNDSFREAPPDGKTRFTQETQVSSEGDALRCPVPLSSLLSAPSNTPSAPLTSPENARVSAQLEAMLAELDKAENTGGGGPLPAPAPAPAPIPTPAILATAQSQPQAPTVTVTMRGGATITPAPAPTLPANINARMPLPWARLTEAGRLYASARYCHAKGGVAVSLNLHNDTAARYTSGQLKTKITDLFGSALRRDLKTAGIVGLPYYLMFELSPAGELHLHGVLDLHDRSQAEIDAIKLALRKAAGQIKGKAAGRQLHLKVIWNGNGWAKYMLKARKIAQARLNLNSLKVSSHAMSQCAGKHHDQARQMPQAA